MPYLSKRFYKTITPTKVGQYYSVNLGNEESYMPYYQHKEATDCFYDSFKQMMVEAENENPLLNITFNDEEKSFTVFDSKFYLLCINTHDAPYLVANYKCPAQQYCVRPFLFKEGHKCQPSRQIDTTVSLNIPVSTYLATTNSGNNSYWNINLSNSSNDACIHETCKNFNGYIHYYINTTPYVYSNTRIEPNDIMSNAAPDYGNCYICPASITSVFGYDDTATIIKYNKKDTLQYTIKIYYTENYIYITFSGAEDQYTLSLGYISKIEQINPITNQRNNLLFTCLIPGGNQSCYSQENGLYLSSVGRKYNKTNGQVNLSYFLPDYNISYRDISAFSKIGEIKQITDSYRFYDGNIIDFNKEYYIRKTIDEKAFYKMQVTGNFGTNIFKDLIYNSSFYGHDTNVKIRERGKFYQIGDEIYFSPVMDVHDVYYSTSKSHNVNVLLKL